MLNHQIPMPLLTITENYSRYLASLGYAKSTIQSYRKDLRTFARIVKDPDEMFSPLKIEKFVNGTNHQGKPLSSAYRNRRLSCLRSFFRYLGDQGLLHDGINPTTGVRFARLRQTEPSSLSYVEYRKIINIIRKQDKGWIKRRDLAIVATLYNTGLRLSELVSLNIEQFDFENVRLTGLKRKGGHVKDLPINQNVVCAIKSWLCFRPLTDNLKKETANNTESDIQNTGNPLFVSQLGRRISQRTVEQMIRNHARRAGIDKPVTPHTFRHSHCTEIQRRGAEARTAQKIMGHRRIETTMRYSHSEEEDIRRAIARLDDEEFLQILALE